MTTIKIRDEQWFKEHCDSRNDGLRYLVPSCWTKEQQRATVGFLIDGSMEELMGRVLVVETDDTSDIAARNMMGSRYFSDFWIPNWAIEWIKEE